MGYEGPEKRIFRRHHIKCVSLMYRKRRIFSSNMTDPSRACEVCDINWRGVRFYAPSRIGKGNVIEVAFDCPLDVDSGNGAGAVRAKVVWQKWSMRRRAWRTGVQFVDLTNNSREGILKMIDSAVEHERRFRNGDQDIL
jgi:hypothetical protein